MTAQQRRLAGRYALETPIGRGGMGEVWRATDTVLGREVAVKTIDLGRVPDESGAARFEREAKVTAGMSHPNVVTVHDTGVEGDTAYLVMELLPGPSLADRVADGPLPVDEVVEVGRQVASALEAAHSRGMVHRDIKPANLVYAADGRVRVLDFGITQLTETQSAQALTATHTVMGTAEYLAPEQAVGGRVDGRADLYALGCVLFALLTGRPPFSGPTAVATMMMHSRDDVPDVREHRPDTPAWLAALVGGLLAKEPQDRPADAAEVVAALETATAPGGGSARTSVLPAAGAAAGAAGGAAVTQRLGRSDPPPPPPPSVQARPRPPERRGGSAALWVLAGVVGIVALLLAWQLFGFGDATGETSSDAPSTSASEPAPETSAPEASTTPEPTEPAPTTAEPTPEETVADPTPVQSAAGALGDEVKRLDREKVLEKDAAKTVDENLRELDKALREDDSGALADARDALVEDYRDAVADGEIPAEAASSLDPLVQDVSNAVDSFLG